MTDHHPQEATTKGSGQEARESSSGIPLKSFYGPEDILGLDYNRDLGDPGSFPFVRARRLETKGREPWIQRELSGEGDPRRSNAQLKFLLARGQRGIDVIGDSPTLALMDPDHPLSYNAIGTQGVSICCLADYAALLDGIPMDEITFSASLPAAFTIAALYLVARQRGLDPGRLRGSVVQAPLYCEDCGYATHMPFALRTRLAADSIAFAAGEMPRFHAFLEDTYYISESGLNAVEEMALGFVEMRHVVRYLLDKGLPTDAFAPRIAILVNCSMDMFEEVAKIRATRRLFARMMKEEFGAVDPRSMAVVITSHTSGLSLTAQQPVNNIIRGTVQALALVLAGVQAMEISAFDEAYRTPSPEAHIVGLRTQQVIHLESRASEVIDPLGGSYYVECLTSHMESRIWEMVQKIESMGDPGRLSDGGWFRGLFEAAMERYSRRLQEAHTKKVGLNVHRVPDEEDTLLREIVVRKIQPFWGRRDEIKRLREQRDSRAVRQSLKSLHRSASRDGSDLMGPIIKAMEAGATIGEMAGVLRMAYGLPHDPFGMTPEPI
jgi:methylmalonyl-CoA mutase N-terminal domain/subunit